ncbi:MAG TPA: HIT domain-containing protein [Patescibacteria group bacterium]|nr:HIT domain-containing protein [Patescibacteria group bacterium]
MLGCIFCKIVSGKFESATVWENDDFVALLDINPNTKGMTLVVSKEHYDSYAVDMDDEMYGKFFFAAKEVSKMLEKGLGVQRVAIVMEGLGINHAHIKLYPIHGLSKKFEAFWNNETVYFDKYQGYISTQVGPKKEMMELKKLAKEIQEKSK